MKRRTNQLPDAYAIFTTAELAHHFHVSDRTIERWCIPSVAPGRYLFQDVLDWCAERRAQRAAA